MDPRDLAVALALLVAAASLAFAWTRRGRAGAPNDSEHLHDRIWQISESEDRYRALVEATTDIIVQRDAAGRITFANESYAALFDRTPRAMLGTTRDLDVLETAGAETGPDGVRRSEARVMPADGVPRWFAFVEVPIARGTAPIQWLRAGRDVTGRIESARALDVALSRAESASVAKSRFLATVSHEFRTPLNGILGMAELVLDTTLDGEQRTYVEAVRTSGQALLALIDGILDFSRIEAGRIDLAAEPFDLAATAEAVVELLAPRAQDKGIEIALDIAEDVPALVVGDGDRVRQILVNLVGNAVKFTVSGGVGVTVARAADDIVLAVADTGPGIAEDRIAVLFEEFEQGDGSASRSHEGTGLGLAITRRLVLRMGGRIEAESKPGRGSTFRVVLPLSPAADQPAAGPRPVLAARRVLIVADSPFQAPFLARNLARSGAAAVVMPNLKDGLDALAGVGFDAVIADRALGDEAVRRLADQAKACGVRCSLVLLSPFDRREFGAPGAAGFDTYLIKPVRARSLFDRLLEPTPPAEAAVTASAAPARAGAGLRVLLAEDNPINALLATKALERLGAEVVHAADGLEALARLAEGGPVRSRADRRPHAELRRTRDRPPHPRRGGAGEGRTPAPRRPDRQCRARGRESRPPGRLRRFPRQTARPEAAARPARAARRPRRLTAASPRANTAVMATTDPHPTSRDPGSLRSRQPCRLGDRRPRRGDGAARRPVAEPRRARPGLARRRPRLRRVGRRLPRLPPSRRGAGLLAAGHRLHARPDAVPDAWRGLSTTADPRPVFRFAPSPNGRLHRGHAYSALLNADLAARTEGRLLLRIEDIDPARSRLDLIDAIVSDLAWLGLTFEPPLRRQSQHMPAYRAALDTLIARGLAYPCFCTRGDIRAAAAPPPHAIPTVRRSIPAPAAGSPRRPPPPAAPPARRIPGGSTWRGRSRRRRARMPIRIWHSSLPLKRGRVGQGVPSASARVGRGKRRIRCRRSPLPPAAQGTLPCRGGRGARVLPCVPGRRSRPVGRRGHRAPRRADELPSRRGGGRCGAGHQPRGPRPRPRGGDGPARPDAAAPRALDPALPPSPPDPRAGRREAGEIEGLREPRRPPGAGGKSRRDPSRAGVFLTDRSAEGPAQRTAASRCAIAVALLDFCITASICSRWRLNSASSRPSSSRPRGTRIFIGSTKWPLMITS